VNKAPECTARRTKRNLGRGYDYSTWRAKGPGVARKILDDIAQLPLEIVNADLELTRTAADLRAEHKLPYIDCFAAALAVNRKAPLATSDKDFTSRFTARIFSLADRPAPNP
jgi:predicted nucleic acid-binding protein